MNDRDAENSFGNHDTENVKIFRSLFRWSAIIALPFFASVAMCNHSCNQRWTVEATQETERQRVSDTEKTARARLDVEKERIAAEHQRLYVEQQMWEHTPVKPNEKQP